MINFLYMLYWFYRRRIVSPVKDKKDLVLEIGSGDKPHWRSDILVDMYLKNNQQRDVGDVLIDRNKTFIIADIGHLPFKDKVFDYIIASHILEHVENLENAIKEISRTGKAGYIEVPSGFLEIIRPFETHIWICDIIDNCLLFKRKNRYSDPIMLKFGEIFFSEKYFSYGIYRNLNKFFIMQEWKDSIIYNIVDIDNDDRYRYSSNDKTICESKSSNSIKFLLKFYYKLMCILFY